MSLFDETALHKHLLRARAKTQEFHSSSFLHREVFSRMLEDLMDFKGHFQKALLHNPHEESWKNDLESITCVKNSEVVYHGDIHRQSYDVILSPLLLHRMNDVEGLLKSYYNALNPGGMLTLSLFGGGSLQELRSALLMAETQLKGGASPRVHPTIALQDLGTLIARAGFKEPVMNAESVVIMYPDMLKIMKDLRGCGETNALRTRIKSFTSRDVFNLAENLYQKNFSTQDGLRVTTDILYARAWK